MTNKSYMVIGVVVLAMAAGTIFWSRDNSSTLDASVLEHGVKNLTRESAAKMIKTSFETKLEIGETVGKTALVGYDEAGEDYYSYSSVNIRKLESAGFIQMSGKGNIYGKAGFKFTDQAKPYIKTGKNQTYIVLAEIVNVEVTGITEAIESDGKTLRGADFTAKFKSTPIGLIVAGANEDVKAQAQFILYDDGWRIAQ